MSYLKFDQETITDFSSKNIESMYDRGFVFTRLGKGIMDQTRSMRINLEAFSLSSENRRILRKTEYISMEVQPLPYANYSWEIGKLAKDFYDAKFGKGTFSANKARELCTLDTSSFNIVLVYSSASETLGYSICSETNTTFHYSFPFYDLEKSDKNMGMGMMIRAIQYAKESGKKYIYLGSAQRPGDTYKLQFSGLEWFDGTTWSQDQDALKYELGK